MEKAPVLMLSALLEGLILQLQIGGSPIQIQLTEDGEVAMRGTKYRVADGVSESEALKNFLAGAPGIQVETVLLPIDITLQEFIKLCNAMSKEQTEAVAGRLKCLYDR